MQTVLTFERTLPAESGADALDELENRIASTLPQGCQLLRWAIVGLTASGEARVEGAYLTPFN
ncbi:MAG: hypothetical protein AB7P76_11580 [Candidatus Melainabacteria bacterium]